MVFSNLKPQGGPTDERGWDLQLADGASVGSIYHYFGSKDGLAAQLYVEIPADHHATYLDALRSSRSAKAGVTGAVHAHLR